MPTEGNTREVCESDFPKMNEKEWNVNIYCRKDGKEMVMLKQNVKEIKGPLSDLIKHT
jgi:hypothetical protein